MQYQCPKCGNLIEEGTNPCPTCGQQFNWPKKDPDPPVVVTPEPPAQTTSSAEPIVEQVTKPVEHSVLSLSPAKKVINSLDIDSDDTPASTPVISKEKKPLIIAAIALIALLLVIVICFIPKSSKYDKLVQEAISSSSDYDYIIRNYISEKNPSTEAMHKKYLKWTKYALSNGNVTAAIDLLSKIQDDAETTSDVENIIDSNIIDTIISKSGYSDAAKFIDYVKNTLNITISESQLAKIKYTSISAKIDDDIETGSVISEIDFKVSAIYPDGSTETLGTSDYSTSEGYFTPGETITVTITENKYNLSTTVKISCPEKKYFTKYTREELSKYMLNHLNEYSNRKYYVSYKTGSNGIITQASYYLANGKYLYFLIFDDTGSDEYSDVRLKANMTNSGSDNTYAGLYRDMENSKAALVGATGGDVGSVEGDGLEKSNGVEYYSGVKYAYQMEAVITQDYVTQVN